jgi:hypothetical protein
MVLLIASFLNETKELIEYLLDSDSFEMTNN